MQGTKKHKSRVLFLILCALFALLLSACQKLPSDPYAVETPPQTTAPRIQGFIPQTEPPAPVTPLPPAVNTVSFIGCGDNLTYYGNTREAKSLAEAGGRTYNFKPTFSNVESLIAEADIAFINQENVMSASAPIAYYPRFNCPTDMAYDLKELGFDVLNIATNHMLDIGEQGLRETIDLLEELDITFLGGYKDQTDAERIRVIEKNGIRIAFLSYTYFTNYLSLPKGSEMVIPYLENEELIKKQFALAKEVSDVILVSVHWGDENTFKPNAIQKQYAQLFADLGAAAVIGHHPHVIQPIEWIEGSEGNRMLCVYSLGNFIAEMERDINMCGGLIGFDIVQTGSEAPVIENVRFTPTVFAFTPRFYENKVHLLEQYTDAMARAHGISYYGNSTTLQKLTSYFTDTIDAAFLPDFLIGSDN